MTLNTQVCYKNLINELNNKAIKHELHDFPSGAKMIDIWYRDLFYVIQIEDDLIGVSLTSEDNPGFDTIPEEKFFTDDAFLNKLKDIFQISLNNRRKV